MNGPKCEIIRGELSNRKMYAGGISYVSESSLGFSGLVSAEAVVIGAMERSKSDKVLAEIVVENYVRSIGDETVT